ncbi:hypothetical protein CLPUN_01300 [Clostridium puniceum]|uniref:Uncharacterized protein n=1 Tax=Clostridium puniceum TaxID=29367 RepID=A0A1S8TXE0_9CLOT|nr:hypothetical protein [Clostridium puniceum]OOM82428.1 hypothetical protein CLPUN_01300 [Clostridium puniceum]
MIEINSVFKYVDSTHEERIRVIDIIDKFIYIVKDILYEPKRDKVHRKVLQISLL